VAVDLRLTVADVVRSPALQLTVLAGETGLDRRVSWAHVSELEDPTPWLLGAELIMTTGMGVPRAAARQRRYLERLDEAGVAALAVSEQLHVPPLQPGFLAAADARGFPVLQVPLPVPFIAIAQEVAAAVQSDMHRRLTAQLHVFGALRTLAAEDLPLTVLVDRLERLSGYRLFACTPQGRPLLPGLSPPPPELADLLPDSYDSPPSVADGYVLPIPAPDGPEGFLLAVEKPGSVPAGLAVVQHIATVAALQLSIRRHERETRRREGAETLAELLAGQLDAAATRRRLTRLGIDVEDQLRLAVLRTPQPPLPDGVAGRAMAALGDQALLLQRQLDAVVLVSASADLTQLSLSSPGLALGVSRPFGLGAPLDPPRREAAWAAARAVDAGGGVVEFADDATTRWLVDDGGAIAALVEDVLGRVLAYDLTHGGVLVPSVRTWLERDRRSEDAAASLSVHPNTLAYRIRRFEQLSGRSLSTTADLAEVWLALRAADRSSATASTGSDPGVAGASPGAAGRV